MANDLTTISALSLPTSVKALLADNDRWVDGAPTRWTPPASLSADERDAVRASIAALKAMLVPATRDQLDAQLMRLALHGANGPGPEARKVLLAEYRGFLAEMPADIVKAGADKHIASSPYWPKVSDLLAIMQPLLDQRRAQLVRAMRLTNAPEKRERYQPTPEERRRFADGFRAAADALRNVTPAGPETP